MKPTLKYCGERALSTMKTVTTLLVGLLGITASSAAMPPPAFAICGACHATRTGAPVRTGPNLTGIMGRKAGAAPDFTYSPAMKGVSFSWNEKMLDAFLASPQKVVLGTKMPYGGEKDPVRRVAIIRYLATLH